MEGGWRGGGLTVFGVRRLRRRGRWEFIERVCTCGGHQSRSILFLSFTPKCGVSAPTCVRIWAGRDCTFLSIAPLSFCLVVVFVDVAGPGMPWQNGPRLVTYSHTLDTRQAAPTLPLCPASPRDPPSSSQLPLLCLTLTLPPPRQIISN